MWTKMNVSLWNVFHYPESAYHPSGLKHLLVLTLHMCPRRWTLVAVV